MLFSTLNKKEVDFILSTKESFLEIEKKLQYGFFSVKEDLLYPLSQDIIDETYIIDILQKLSETQKQKTFTTIIDYIFYIDEPNFNKDSKISTLLLEYLHQNVHSFHYEYILIIKHKLLQDSKTIGNIYEYLINHEFETLKYGSELLTEICFYDDIDKLLHFIHHLIFNKNICLIPYSNKHPFKILFNRAFNTTHEHKVIDLLFHYLLNRKINSEWFSMLDVVRSYQNHESLSGKFNEISEKLRDTIDEHLKREFLASEVKLQIIKDKTREVELDFYELFKCHNTLEFNQKLSEFLSEAIFLGDGEVGQTPNYSTIIIKDFLPISGTDLKNYKFLSKVTYTDESFTNANIIVYALNQDYGFCFQPPFNYDWVQIDDLIKFLNYILQSEKVQKQFVFTTDYRVLYQPIKQ